MTLPCFNEKYQNSQVSETKEFTSHFYKRSAEPDFRREKVPIMCYRGSQNKPEWLDTDPGGHHDLSADLSELLFNITVQEILQLSAKCKLICLKFQKLRNGMLARCTIP